MPPEGKGENSRGFCKVFYKKIFFRLPRALEKYRKLYISPLDFPLFSYYYSLVNRPATTN